MHVNQKVRHFFYISSFGRLKSYFRKQNDATSDSFDGFCHKLHMNQRTHNVVDVKKKLLHLLFFRERRVYSEKSKQHSKRWLRTVAAVLSCRVKYWRDVWSLQRDSHERGKLRARWPPGFWSSSWSCAPTNCQPGPDITPQRTGMSATSPQSLVTSHQQPWCFGIMQHSRSLLLFISSHRIIAALLTAALQMCLLNLKLYPRIIRHSKLM